MTDKIVILDFGSQYTQLIARRLRELNVYCEIYPYNKFPAADPQVKAVVLSGSPFSVLQEESLEVDLSQILGKYPTLGVCYGAQYIAHTQGGKVAKSAKREYGKAMLEVVMPDDHMMLGISNPTQVWMSHGANMLGNFVSNVAGIKADWTPEHFVNDTVAKLKETLGVIGRVFIEVFEAEANKLDGVKWLGQGTIYPDVIESVSVHGPSVTIKSHHNVGGLPDHLNLQIVEPLRMLFKDEVRRVGLELGINKELIGRHPFPGPGLAIRVLGELTRDKIALCQEADYIFINNLRKHDLYDKVWQAGAILLPVQSVGVMGDERTYEFTIALRCVNSVDGMTAEWSNLPYEFLSKVSTEIINQVKGINRVVYDISTKPPATIEWE